MRTRSILTLYLLTAGTAFGQPTTATQTVRLSVQPVVRITASSEHLMIGLEREGRNVPGGVHDRIVVRGRAGGKVSASLNSPMPGGMRLGVQVGVRSLREVDRIELVDGAQAFDIATGLRSGSVHERAVEYRLLSDGAHADAPSGDRTVVYTLTD